MQVSNQQLVLDLPESFQQKRVMVIIEDLIGTQASKLELMKQAASDPLYLADQAEVQDDFRSIDGETM